MKTLFILMIAAMAIAACNEPSTVAKVETPISLHDSLQNYLSSIDAHVGVAVSCIETEERFVINDQFQYPTMSVLKFPLAVYMLHLIDEKKYSLDQKILITKADLLPETHSPLRDSMPNGNFDLSISELIKYTICQSDNNTCDILFRLVGGTDSVNNYLQNLGYTGIQIGATEAEMGKIDSAFTLNWCFPSQMNQFIQDVFYYKHLSQTNTEYIKTTMEETTTGATRLKLLLPANSILAHKTGSGNHIVNDVGMITLPNGKHIAITVLISNSNIEYRASEAVIAQIGEIVATHYQK